jgi:hypothetical protein
MNRSGRDHRRGKRGLSANQWWHYSEGLKDVVSEFAAYLVCLVSVLPLISGATSSARSSRFDRPGPETRKF